MSSDSSIRDFSERAIDSSLEVDRLPTVSIVLPVRNEASFIIDNLTQLLEQDYPHHLLEIIVADGLSIDGTKELLTAFCEAHPSVRAIDNPGQIVPTGINAAIRASRGEIVVRVDGHAIVADDFILESVRQLQSHPDAWGAGGPLIHEGRSAFGKAVAVAMAHPIGVGNATHRFIGFEGYGEGTNFPAFHRWVFDRIGYYDETLVRTEDDEFYYRVHRAGGRFFISPKVRYIYYVRDHVGQLFRQYFQYSFWRIPLMRKYGRPTTVRQVIPLLFFFVMAVLFVVGLLLQNVWLALSLPTVYAVTLAFVGIAATRKLSLASAALLPFAILLMHVAYAWGMLVGFVALAFRRSWFDPAGKMTKLSR